MTTLDSLLNTYYDLSDYEYIQQFLREKGIKV